MIKNIIFDFDGVILDSVPIKTEAFRKLFEEYPIDKVDELIQYHLLNGGKSRYLKIKYFFETILNQDISNEEILNFASIYSELTKQELSKEKYLILDTVGFIENNFKNYNLHIASGADENDLRYICKKLKLEKYFLSIHGSPKIKNDIVRDILKDCKYQKEETILIGDSINDLEAANFNKIVFYGFNNDELKEYNYIEIFNQKIFSD